MSAHLFSSMSRFVISAFRLDGQMLRTESFAAKASLKLSKG
jgi:hypothetical protein